MRKPPCIAPSDRGLSESPEDRLIRLIYSATLTPDSWQPFVDAFRSQTSAYLAIMTFRLLREGPTTLSICSSETDGIDFFEQYAQNFTHLNPVDYDRMESGHLYSMQDFVSEDFEKSELYLRHLEPAGMGEIAILPLGPNDGFRAHLSWVHKKIDGNIHKQGLCKIQKIIHHLEQGVKIFGEIKLSRLANELYTDALDHLSFGVVALDKDGRVLFSNHLADSIIAGSSDIASRDGRLRFCRKTHADTVASLMTAAVMASEQGRVEKVIRLQGSGGIIAALLKPIVNMDAFGTVTSARVVIFLHSLSEAGRPSASLLSQLLGLAPSEASLAILLSEGMTLREAGQKLGITEHSARSRCKQIFAKTGIGRQADLVRLVLRSVAMLGDS